MTAVRVETLAAGGGAASFFFVRVDLAKPQSLAGKMG
jgi:hypothetical protein